MYLLDSNILISYLDGNTKIRSWFEENRTSTFYISVVTAIETLSLHELAGEQLYIANRFVTGFRTISLFEDMAMLVAGIRRKEKLSLSDAVVLATAISRRLTLITNDKFLIKKGKPYIDIISIT